MNDLPDKFSLHLTMEHFDRAIAAKIDKCNPFDLCTQCVIAQAARDMFGDKFSLMGTITMRFNGSDNSSVWYKCESARKITTAGISEETRNYFSSILPLTLDFTPLESVFGQL
jgi:hypothetical protein